MHNYLCQVFKAPVLFVLLCSCIFSAVAESNVFDQSLLQNKQSFISVSGNKFVDENNQVFVFRGVSVADPDSLLDKKQWNKQLFEVVHSWGANTIRLPIHPRAWRKHGNSDYLKLLDQAVVWANELDMYLIIDWHSIGYLETGKYQSEGYITDKTETFDFWQTIAQRYKNIPTTAIYELFNEPTTLQEPWGKKEWLQWKALNEQMIDIIYKVDTRVIPIVAGFNWAYDLSYVMDYPVEREGIAYVSHPYPQKVNPKPPSKKKFHKAWEKTWGHVSQKYPLILTELGWVQADGYGAHVPVKNDGSYGPHILDYMETRGISWIAWVFDPQWSPTMINNWDFEPSEQGAFWRKSMLEARAREAKK